MRLAGVLGRWAVAAQHILAVRDRLQVIRATARTWAIGPMIKLQAVGDGANKQFVNKRMGLPIATSHLETTVAIQVEGPSPEPVTIGLCGAILVKSRMAVLSSMPTV